MAGQRTMPGLNDFLTAQILPRPVMLTGHINRITFVFWLTALRKFAISNCDVTRYTYPLTAYCLFGHVSVLNKRCESNH